MLRDVRSLAGPKVWPVVGNLPQFDMHNFPATMEAWSRRYGKLYRFRLPNQTFVAVGLLPEISAILKQRPEVFARPARIRDVINEINGVGLFSAEGETWRRHRKITAPAFQNAHLKTFYPSIVKITESLLSHLSKPEYQNTDLDILHELMRYTVDVTTELAFGRSLNTLSGGEDVIQRHLDVIFPAISRRFAFPWPYWRYFSLPSDLRLKRAVAEVNRAISSMVAATRAHLALNAGAAPRNYLEALLGAQPTPEGAVSDQDLYGNIMTILLAGEDTSANTMAWTLDFLARHPEVQARVRAEADAVCAGEIAPATFAAQEQLEYLDAVLAEAMRLCPVAPALLLEALKDTEIAGVRVPRGHGVAALLRIVATDPEHFTEPQRFAPERWLDAERPISWRHNPKASMPFGGGARLCPGRALAMVEMKLVIAALCRAFVVEPPRHAARPRERFSFVSSPYGLRVVLKPRPRPHSV